MTDCKIGYKNSKAQFTRTKAYTAIQKFIAEIDQGIKSTTDASDADQILPELKAAADIIEKTELSDEPTRFANRAMVDVIRKMEQIKPDNLYFMESFGNRVRMDYGTGHELNFLCYLFVLRDYDFTRNEDVDFVVENMKFYMESVRKFITKFNLEPAGSRGCWSIDDFSLLGCVFGSSLLVKQDEMSPFYRKHIDMWQMAVSNPNPLLRRILIQEPIKINKGMLRMYYESVLERFVVTQHFIYSSKLSDELIDYLFIMFCLVSNPGMMGLITLIVQVWASSTIMKGDKLDMDLDDNVEKVKGGVFHKFIEKHIEKEYDETHRREIPGPVATKRDAVAIDLGGSTLRISLFEYNKKEEIHHQKGLLEHKIENKVEERVEKYIQRHLDLFMATNSIKESEVDIFLTFSYDFTMISPNRIRLLDFSKIWQFPRVNEAEFEFTPYCIVNDSVAVVLSKYDPEMFNIAFVCGTGFNCCYAEDGMVVDTEMGMCEFGNTTLDSLLAGGNLVKVDGSFDLTDPLTKERLEKKLLLLKETILVVVRKKWNRSKKLNLILNGSVFKSGQKIIDEIADELECVITLSQNATLEFVMNM
ncbi:PTPA [Enterospora canceri]|uniref:Serine/threonine-protein phosphatase 2A activator n=1 Tax=Enterospora canceri TaxID=1081671 RepID=A0A1Y1S5R8_9MICR|nr:PTPA [Enterospora canceri]